MIDTHAHIYDPQFEGDLEQVLHRAWQEGVEEIWMPNCNSATIAPMYALASAFPNRCLPMMGLHPSYVNETYLEELQRVEEEWKNRSFIMVGEIGLDYYWDLTFVREQEEAFRRQLQLALEYNKPVCIHSRNTKDQSLNAIQRCCEIIEEVGDPKLRGIFHCFSGTLEDAQRIIELPFLLGIGGVATFKNGGLGQFLTEIPLEHIVLETDAPYLAPVPFRGKRNEPSYVKLVLDRVAAIYNTDCFVVQSITTQNARRLLA